MQLSLGRTFFLLACSGVGAASCSIPPTDREPDASVSEPEQTEVVDSSPLLNEVGVYPAPLEAGLGAIRRMSVEFSKPMQPVATLRFTSDAGSRELEATWSNAGTSLRLSILAPAFSGQPPLIDETDYTLDLSDLVDLAGRPLAPEVKLKGGQLRFRTGTLDPLLNHSCGHVEFGPFKSVSAAAHAGVNAPRTDAPHTRYTIGLRPSPSDGGFEGFTRFEPSGSGRFTLFFDQASPMRLTGALRDELLTPVPTPRACDGISHRASFLAVAGEELSLHIQPIDVDAVRVIVEAQYE